MSPTTRLELQRAMLIFSTLSITTSVVLEYASRSIFSIYCAGFSESLDVLKLTSSLQIWGRKEKKRIQEKKSIQKSWSTGVWPLGTKAFDAGSKQPFECYSTLWLGRKKKTFVLFCSIAGQHVCSPFCVFDNTKHTQMPMRKHWTVQIWVYYSSHNASMFC